ncbi:MAG: glycosyltransferase [Bacteroidales bacterium]|nr:glycosyltransferase [Bacteroidales bacterium]
MKIFVLLSRFPYPLEKGDKLRAYNQLKQLSKNNKIHLCALNDIRLKSEYLEALDPICESVTVINLSRLSIMINIVRAFFSGKPLQVGYFYNCRAKRKIQNLIKSINPDHIYCQLIRVSEYVKDLQIPKTLDYQDVFSKGVQRRSQTAPFYMKPLLMFEYKRLLKYEKLIFDYFDHKTIISIPDRDLIPHPRREEIEVVINGVDTEFFKPMDVEKEYDLVFIGNMGYPPNVNAAEYLAKEILPLVHKTHPHVTLTLAGATPHPSVFALQNEKVHVTGFVEDIRECYAKARIFIAPMRIGTGLQNKLLEAMAMKIPSITSALANSALEAEIDREILVGESAQDFAIQIIRLLEDKDYADGIAENGFRFVHARFDWTAATKKLEKIISNNLP